MAKKKILVIDDEESFVEMVKLSLEETGEYEVATELESSRAILAIKQTKPDLIFLDVMMPGIGGGEIAQQLKLDADTKDIPLVFLTAIVSEKEVEARRKDISGGHPFISKLVSPDKLIECIKKYVP